MAGRPATAAAVARASGAGSVSAVSAQSMPGRSSRMFASSWSGPPRPAPAPAMPNRSTGGGAAMAGSEASVNHSPRHPCRQMGATESQHHTSSASHTSRGMLARSSSNATAPTRIANAPRRQRCRLSRRRQARQTPLHIFRHGVALSIAFHVRHSGHSRSISCHGLDSVVYP